MTAVRGAGIAERFENRSRRRSGPWVAIVLAALAASFFAPALAHGATTSTSRAASSKPAGLGHPTYLVLTFGAHKLILYVDGRPSAAKPESVSPDPGGKTVEIGAFLGRHHWQGAIDELALYKTALSAQAVAAHYRLGTTGGSGYSQAVRATPGLTDYWRFDDPHRIVDSVGHAAAARLGSRIVRWYSLIGDHRDQATALNGFDSEIRLSGVPRFSSAFSLEIWVLPGPQVSNRTIVARPGAWFLNTDILGRWSGGFFSHGHLLSVTSAIGAAPKLPPRTAPPTSHARPATSSATNGGTSPVVTVVLLMVIAALAAAAIPILRRRRSLRAEDDAHGPDAGRARQ